MGKHLLLCRFIGGALPNTGQPERESGATMFAGVYLDLPTVKPCHLADNRQAEPAPFVGCGFVAIEPLKQVFLKFTVNPRT